jgi:hypothetical protein
MNLPDSEIFKYVVTVGIALLPLLVALPPNLKAWKELGHLLRAHRRDECEFALRMVKEIADPNIKGAMSKCPQHLSHQFHPLFLKSCAV